MLPPNVNITLKVLCLTLRKKRPTLVDAGIRVKVLYTV